MKVLLNDFVRQWADTEKEVTAAVQAVGASGWYILGERVRAFESDLCRFWGLPNSVGVANGLDAIEMSLRALGCGPGDEVLTSPISAFATALAALKLGAKPVFVDCDRYGLIDLDACELFLRQHSRVRYFVPVHLFGHALDGQRLRYLRDQFELRIVEDCAQSIGAAWRGEPVGAVGQSCATSFYPTKNLGAMGDGGAILTADPAIANTVRVLRDYGQTQKYRHELIGYNSRLDELQAAILSTAFLPKLRSWTEKRNVIASRYIQELNNPEITVPGTPDGSSSSWHLFPALVDPKQKLAFRSHLERSGIATGEHYPLALVDQPALSEFLAGQADTPLARQFCSSEVSLPIHPYLSSDEVTAVIESCNAWKP